MHILDSENLVNWSAGLLIPHPEMPGLVVHQLDVIGMTVLTCVLGKVACLLAVCQFHLPHKAEVAKTLTFAGAKGRTADSEDQHGNAE